VIDVEVVRDRFRSYVGTPVPASVARLAVWLAEDRSHVELFAAQALFQPTFDLAIADLAAAIPARDTFRYESEPPEFIPFGRTGADGEKIGVLELAPELERAELPFVTYFPAEYWHEVATLGDDLRGALGNFIAVFGDTEFHTVRLPGLFDERIPRGVFSGEPPKPSVIPDGYRFLRSGDHVGVLAPADAFGEAGPTLRRNSSKTEFESAAGRVESDLSRGYPASAIAIARDIRYFSGTNLEPVLDAWRRAALVLRRPWHAAMIEEIEDQNAATVDAPTDSVFVRSSTGVVFDEVDE
jgi:hypothetical protein